MDIITPSLLFSGICLLMGVYNGIYLQLSSRIREITDIQIKKGRRDKNEKKLLEVYLKKIECLKKMQLSAVSSLFLSTLSIFFILIDTPVLGKYIFSLSILAFMLSLFFALKDIIYYNVKI
jgi:hypothetical protein